MAKLEEEQKLSPRQKYVIKLERRISVTLLTVANISKLKK